MTSARMPDLCRPQRGVRHTLDSAVPALLRLGVDIDRIVLESAGTGWPEGTVVRQGPAPGEPLAPQTRVVLAVAGLGALDHLPYALRDADEGGLGVDRLFALFDNPLHKVQHHLRAAGQFFRLRPDDPEGARRWIETLFGVDASAWDAEFWYPIARLLPALHRIAGTAEAVPLALPLVFGLPVAGVRLVSHDTLVDAHRQFRLGAANARLGVDAIVGVGVRASTGVEVTFGPLDLARYRRHHTDRMRRQRDALYRLLLPCHIALPVRERWSVGDPSRGVRLGDTDAGTVLGVSTYLGAQPERRVA